MSWSLIQTKFPVVIIGLIFFNRHFLAGKKKKKKNYFKNLFWSICQYFRTDFGI